MIGIIAPYGRNEVTGAACRLADLAVASGVDVRFVASGVHEQNIHPYWDTKVLSGRNWSASKHAPTCDTVVHFNCTEALLNGITTPKGHTAKHVLVPSWHGMNSDDVYQARRYDQVVCPSKAGYEAFKTLLHHDKPVAAEKLTWCRWEPGLTRVVRKVNQPTGKLRVCVLCDHTAIDYAGRGVLRLIDELLMLDRSIHITLLSLKSWAKAERKEIRRIAGYWQVVGPSIRFTHARVNPMTLCQAFNSHDWVVIPSTFADFGLYATQAVACGAAVIAPDIAPFDEVLGSGTHGALVPGQIVQGRFGSAMHVFDVATWYETCKRALRDPSLLYKARTAEWPIADWHRAFDTHWNRVWHLT